MYVMDGFQEEFNLTLPEWTKEFYPDQMLEPTIFSFILNAWNDKMNRLKGGKCLPHVLNLPFNCILQVCY